MEENRVRLREGRRGRRVYEVEGEAVEAEENTENAVLQRDKSGIKSDKLEREMDEQKEEEEFQQGVECGGEEGREGKRVRTGSSGWRKMMKLR